MITKHCLSVGYFNLFFISCGVDPVNDLRKRSSCKKWVEGVFSFESGDVFH